MNAQFYKAMGDSAINVEKKGENHYSFTVNAVPCEFYTEARADLHQGQLHAKLWVRVLTFGVIYVSDTLYRDDVQDLAAVSNLMGRLQQKLEAQDTAKRLEATKRLPEA